MNNDKNTTEDYTNDIEIDDFCIIDYEDDTKIDELQNFEEQPAKSLKSDDLHESSTRGSVNKTCIVDEYQPNDTQATIHETVYDNNNSEKSMSEYENNSNKIEEYDESYDESCDEIEEYDVSSEECGERCDESYDGSGECEASFDDGCNEQEYKMFILYALRLHTKDKELFNTAFEQILENPLIFPRPMGLCEKSVCVENDKIYEKSKILSHSEEEIAFEKIDLINKEHKSLYVLDDLEESLTDDSDNKKLKITLSSEEEIHFEKMHLINQEIRRFDDENVNDKLVDSEDLINEDSDMCSDNSDMCSDNSDMCSDNSDTCSRNNNTDEKNNWGMIKPFIHLAIIFIIFFSLIAIVLHICEYLAFANESIKLNNQLIKNLIQNNITKPCIYKASTLHQNVYNRFI